MKMKEDYLALEEFQDEKIECAVDGYFWSFDECVRQVQILDPNFNIADLKRGDTFKDEEDKEGEEVEKQALHFILFSFPLFSDAIKAYIVTSSP